MTVHAYRELYSCADSRLPPWLYISILVARIRDMVTTHIWRPHPGVISPIDSSSPGCCCFNAAPCLDGFQPTNQPTNRPGLDWPGLAWTVTCLLGWTGLDREFPFELIFGEFAGWLAVTGPPIFLRFCANRMHASIWSFTAACLPASCAKVALGLLVPGGYGYGGCECGGRGLVMVTVAVGTLR